MTNEPGPGTFHHPGLEIDLFLATVDEALDLVLARRPEDGAAELRYGMARARAAVGDGEEWGPELLERYRKALVNFCFRYRMKSTV